MRNADQTRGWLRTCTYGAVVCLLVSGTKKKSTRLNEAASLDLHFALGALFRRSAVRALHGQGVLAPYCDGLEIGASALRRKWRAKKNGGEWVDDDAIPMDGWSSGLAVENVWSG